MTVRQIEPPAVARRLSTLPRVDYADAFVADVSSLPQMTGEEWARAIFEDAHSALRHALRAGWQSLGLRIGPARSDRHVLGWELRRSTGDHALLGAESRLGLAAELLLKPEGDTVLFSTLIRQGNPAARALWAAITPGHQWVVRYVLEQGFRVHAPA